MKYHLQGHAYYNKPSYTNQSGILNLIFMSQRLIEYMSDMSRHIRYYSIPTSTITLGIPWKPLWWFWLLHQNQPVECNVIITVVHTRMGEMSGVFDWACSESRTHAASSMIPRLTVTESPIADTTLTNIGDKSWTSGRALKSLDYIIAQPWSGNRGAGGGAIFWRGGAIIYAQKWS